MRRLIILALVVWFVSAHWSRVPTSLRSPLEATGKELKALPTMVMKEWCPELGTDLSKFMQTTRQELSEAIAPSRSPNTRSTQE